MTTHVTLYLINGVTESWQDDPFDRSKLPAQIIPDVPIENVKAMFNEQTFSCVGNVKCMRPPLFELNGVPRDSNRPLSLVQHKAMILFATRRTASSHCLLYGLFRWSILISFDSLAG